MGVRQGDRDSRSQGSRSWRGSPLRRPPLPARLRLDAFQLGDVDQDSHQVVRLPIVAQKRAPARLPSDPHGFAHGICLQDPAYHLLKPAK